MVIRRTSSLWSVSTVNTMLLMNSSSRSHPYVTPKISFSIAAFLCTVSVNERDRLCKRFSGDTSLDLKQDCPETHNNMGISSCHHVVFVLALDALLKRQLISDNLVIFLTQSGTVYTEY